MPPEPAAPASAKMIDLTAAAKVAADYGTLDKNQTGLKFLLSLTWFVPSGKKKRRLTN
jgi:hypothetical protein